MWTELVTGVGRTVVSTVSCSGQRNAERPTQWFLKHVLFLDCSSASLEFKIAEVFKSQEN